MDSYLDNIGEMRTQTVEIPLTPAMHRVIAAEGRQFRRKLLLISSCVIAVLLLFGVLIEALFLMTSVSGALAVILLGAGMWTNRKANQDLRESHYLNTTGPLSITEVSLGGESTGAYQMRLGDRSFMLGSTGAQIPSLRWASVDYTKHVNLIFEVRDADGRSVYRHPEHDGGT